MDYFSPSFPLTHVKSLVRFTFLSSFSSTSPPQPELLGLFQLSGLFVWLVLAFLYMLFFLKVGYTHFGTISPDPLWKEHTSVSHPCFFLSPPRPLVSVLSDPCVLRAALGYFPQMSLCTKQFLNDCLLSKPFFCSGR